MKAIKKKIFTKGAFLFLALMLMLTPMVFSVAATDDMLPTIDECCVSEEVSEMTGEYMPITMSSSPCTCGWNSSSETATCGYCGKEYTVKKSNCSLHGNATLPHCTTTKP